MEIKSSNSQIFRYKIMKTVISKSFTFEAAHHLLNTTDKKNKNIHGHSFFGEVFFEGEVKDNGMIVDFEIINRNLKSIINKLDHSFLNKIPNLGNPTLENIGLWIWNELSKKNKNIYKVKVSRKSCGEEFIVSK